MSRTSNILWGLVFVIIGVIFGLNALEITNINIFFDGWWTLFLIVPSFIDLFKTSNKTSNLIILSIGIILLLGCQDIINFKLIMKLIFPTILVIIGLSMVFKDVFNHKIKDEIKKLNDKNAKEYCATFGGQDLDFTGEDFKGCNLNAVFGGVKCNLKEAKIKENVVINASAIFGGITIFIPDNVNVKVNSVPVFGGVDNKIRNNKDNNKTIYINATCMFGGVEIK